MPTAEPIVDQLGFVFGANQKQGWCLTYSKRGWKLDEGLSAIVERPDGTPRRAVPADDLTKAKLIHLDAGCHRGRD